MKAPSDIQLRERHVASAKRIVVKIGSGVLAGDGRLDKRAVGRLGRDIAAIHSRNIEVVLVSSGAVACGLAAMNLNGMPKSIVDKQAAAAVGQQLLMNAWSNALAKTGITVAQVLLTAEDLDHRTRYLNARHTMQALLASRILPVVNENDSVSYDEIKMGDNDHLSALVATLVSAGLLILLTSVDGLMRGGLTGSLISIVRKGESVLEHAATAKSQTGVGGMHTKLQAVRLVGHAGIPAVIASGKRPGALKNVLAAKNIGTFFEPHGKLIDSRRRWIATATRTRGRLLIDQGACNAIRTRSASLLPSGIVAVEGSFEAGDTVRICDLAGRPIARGLVNYKSTEVAKVVGRKSSDLPNVLGYRYMSEIVHRNDMALEP